MTTVNRCPVKIRHANFPINIPQKLFQKSSPLRLPVPDMSSFEKNQRMKCQFRVPILDLHHLLVKDPKNHSFSSIFFLASSFNKQFKVAFEYLSLLGDGDYLTNLKRK